MSSGTVRRHEQVRDSLAGTSKGWSVCAFPRAPSTFRPVRASASVSRTTPVCRAADWFVTLTVNSRTSPSRRNRGGLGWTMRSLVVTALPSKYPARSCLSCAKPRNRHSVSASGMVNSIFTSPCLLETRCGKKKAVSFKFLRADTWVRSGLGGWAAAPPLSSSLSASRPRSSLPSAFFAKSCTSGTPTAGATASSIMALSAGALGSARNRIAPPRARLRPY